MTERESQAFRVVASGNVVDVIVRRHSFGWCVGEGLRNPVYDDPRDAVAEYAGRRIPGVEEIRGPGEATTAEALDAAVSGYRRGVAARVVDALTEARDACNAIVQRDGDWDDSNCGGQCVAVLDDMIAGKVTQ